LQSHMQLSYPDPRLVKGSVSRQPHEDLHEKNSHAHLSVAKRRHVLNISGNCEKSYRSQHAPHASPPPQFFASPEPEHMAAYLYPEGPSKTARYYPDHFGANFVKNDREASSGVSNASYDRPDHQDKRPSGYQLWDGSRKAEVKNVVPDVGTRRRTLQTSPTAERVKWSRDGFPPKQSEPFVYYNSPGTAPRTKSESNRYKSHAQLQYDKNNCQADDFRHSSHWERIEAGSCGHTAGSSEWDSNCSRSGPRSQDPSRRVSTPREASRRQGSIDREASRRQGSSDRGASRRQGSTERVSKPMRSRSADQAQRTRRQSPRAASSERVPQRRERR